MSSAKLTPEQHHHGLAVNLPSGKIWANKYAVGSNLYKLLSGIVPSFTRMDEALQTFQDQMFPFTTSDYLSEWEDCLGIPDDCIPLSSDDDIRRRSIRVKLKLMRGIQTRPDFLSLANEYGFDDYQFHSGIEHVTVAQGGYELYFPVLDITGDLADVQEARNTLVVVEGSNPQISFPWEFPLQFAASGQVELRCLIQKLVPASTTVIFVEGV